MADEKLRKMAEDALSRLYAELEAGHSDAMKNYLSAMGRFHRYSWGNVLLIASQKPSATQVAGFHTWHQLGRSVKKGEKGIMIFAPMLVKEREPSPAVQSGKADPAFRLAGFRSAYVFDIQQTDGQPLPQFATTTGDPEKFGEKLRSVVAGRGISVEYDPSIAPALGMSSGGRIRLQPGLPPAEEFSVLAHELAHEMLHHGKSASPLPKVVRETQAEAVAFVVSSAVGLETNKAASDYIALYNGDKKTLAESLAVIQETAAKILEDLLPRERPGPSLSQTSQSTTPQPSETRTEHTAAHSEPPDAGRSAPDSQISSSWDR
jgi:antirestriction protein ArdC